MKTHDTVAGKMYTVTSPVGCTVTDETGLQLGTVEAGEQKTFVATGAQLAVDDDTARVTATFNRAASVLGLLGGGVKSELPAGYFRAEFLENVGAYNVKIQLPVWFNPAADSVKIKTEHRGFKKDVMCGEGIQIPTGLAYGHYHPNEVFYMCGTLWKAQKGFVDLTDEQYHLWEIDSTPSEHKFLIDGKLYYSGNEDLTSLEGCNFALFGMSNDSRYFTGKKRYWNLDVNGKKVARLLPVLDVAGVPCMLNLVDRGAHYPVKGGFVVGFTLKQARKLGKHLPATKGSLTISLPTGYEQDSAVAESLETARARGWTLTVQTYEAEAAATTFGMRRVWVRRTQDEQGGYVDADGVRWSVDWCVDMVTPDGSTPDQYGYELYRSTEAAVAYWELTPWVDPEAEELLTTESL